MNNRVIKSNQTITFSTGRLRELRRRIVVTNNSHNRYDCIIKIKVNDRYIYFV